MPARMVFAIFVALLTPAPAYPQEISSSKGEVLVSEVEVFLDSLLTSVQSDYWAISELKKMAPEEIARIRQMVTEQTVIPVVSATDPIHQLRTDLTDVTDSLNVQYLLQEDQFSSKKQLIYDGLNEDWSYKFTGDSAWDDTTVYALSVFSGLKLLCLAYLQESIELPSGQNYHRTYVEESRQWLREIFQMYISPANELESRSKRKVIFLEGSKLNRKFLWAGREMPLGIALIAAAEQGQTEKVETLLTAGAEVDSKDEEGATSLMHAALSGHAETVKVLLAAGAEVETAHDDVTPLMFAAGEGNAETVEALLAAGAYLNMIDNTGLTPLQYAVIWRNLETLKTLIAKGANPNGPNASGLTALMMAVQAGNKEIVRELLAGKVDLNEEHYLTGTTALQTAVMFDKVELVGLLVAAGAEMDAQDLLGRTALMLAASEGQTATVNLLLEAGADVNARSDSGSTALTMAEKQGHPEIVELLKRAGAKE